MALSYRPSPTALLNPCADPIFKILFTDESQESKEALTCFLSDVLEKPVTDVELQPNELSGEALDDKQAEFDINCKLDGQIVNMEIQGRNHNASYGKRAEYHVAHILNHYTPKGTPWQNIPPVFQISVLNFIFLEDDSNCISWYTMKNENGREISGTMNVIFIELPKIRELPDDPEKLTKTEMWGKFFLYASKEDRQDYIKELSKHNRGIAMAVTVLENVSRDEMNWYHESRYWIHVADLKTQEKDAIERGLKNGLEQGLQQGIQQGIEQGLQQGLQEGLQQGLQQGIEQTAKNFLQMGLSVEQIAQGTGLSIEEITELQKNISE